MHILVTNDDGILAPGIVALAKALSEIAKITVIAPDRNMSGVSSAISLETPLRVMEVRDNWYQLNGTPADCAKLALSGFLNDEPDLVVSGINSGQNLGDDVVYSGTVGAAIEGRFLGLPSIAISCAGSKEPMHFDTAAQIALKLVKNLKRQPIDPGLILNVNVPNLPLSELKGIRVTRQGERHFSEPLVPTVDGRDKRIYWLGEPGRIKDGSEGTDFHAIHTGYVAVTPMRVDMTAHQMINKMQRWVEEMQ
ncbi:MAG: 5'/3'-nucleotidase SurE [Gammaproteobacteria bacterium]|nr:5'/3'-nucleotidase SurE [Gammaproteobacteria bacterium]